MLHILTAQEAFQKNKHSQNGSILMEPSIFASNFLIRSFDKFGIMDVDAELLYLIDTQQNIHNHSLSNQEQHFVRMVSRPIYGNTDRIFEKSLEELNNGNEVFSTPGAASLFLKWLKEEEIEFSFDINSSFTLENLAEEYSAIQNRDFYPVVLERLLKLWFIFYGKYISKEETKEIGIFQSEILKGNYSEEKVDKVYELVDKIKKQELEKAALPSNNIFNKIIEETLLFKNVLSNQGEIISGSFDILSVNPDKIESDKAMYQELFS